MKDLPFKCGCGRRYENTGEWEALPLVGYTCFPNDSSGPETHLELRNCQCGSTKAVGIAIHPNCKETAHV